MSANICRCDRAIDNGDGECMKCGKPFTAQDVYRPKLTLAERERRRKISAFNRGRAKPRRAA